VFGVGDPNARVVLVGEAPGKNEDLKGEPFVGAAGQLLNELLAEAGLARDEVYIANVLKCRPPGNRNPEQAEIETCTPFLREQIRVINPAVLVTLGNFATKFVLKTDVGITRLHGRVQTAGRFKVLPIYHPAASIYDRSKRDDLIADFRLLRGLLGEFEAECDAGDPSADHQAEPDQSALF
jgi:DNA polymerase